MICKTNHLLFDHQYKLYVDDNHLLIGKEKKSIKYNVQLQNQTSISWIFDGTHLLGFKLLLHQKWKQFDMSHNDCLKFKYLLDGRVGYNNIESLYNFGDTIGLGSYSEVILVVNQLDNRQYAAKKMQLYKKNVYQLFQNEIKSLQILKHPHIVQMQEFYIKQSECYIIINYIEGESLSKFFRYNKRRSLQEIICILKQLLEVLHYIHSSGFIHRDIKPENILIDKNHKNATLIDFGLATRIGEDQLNAGTPGYIAPELFKNKQPTSKCDIFSLGSVFYEMIYGQKLFQGESLHDIQYVNMQCEFSLTLFDHPLHELLTQMLQKKPKLRISAEEGLALLKQVESAIHI